jgi:IclR family acetate operon transcriptional repressor
MESLARQSNESVSLGVLNAGSVLFVQRIESPNILRADIRLGSRMPLHASASGKALLAAMSDDQVAVLLPESLPTTARRTVRQLPVLLTELRDVRQRGYATQDEEFVDGIAALAAPVYDTSGRVLAALSIAGPSARFDEMRWAKLLLPAASQMSQLCGFHVHRAAFGSNGDRDKAKRAVQGA